jgi:CheY-like chemotaxis protein
MRKTPLAEAGGDVPVSRIHRDVQPSFSVPSSDGPAVSSHTPDHRPSILVAEDHTDSREALRILLGATGYEVHTAVDGRDAVEQALALQPDLILMDIMMPVMDGFEATRTLRAAPEFRQSPIIAITAMDGAKELALAAGCSDYLPKPIDVRTFLNKIAEWAPVPTPRGS